MKSFIVTIFLLIPIAGFSQQKDTINKVAARVNGIDTMRIVNLPVIDVFGAIDPFQADNLRKYLKLRRDVLRAYPYAKLASEELKIINDSTMKIKSDRAKKKYIKETEKELKSKFEKDLKNLTFTQGRILIKLIDRETGNTSYNLVKELRGTFQAFFWQSFARFFGTNLKSEYDPKGDDMLIESIVQAIERGELQVVKK